MAGLAGKAKRGESGKRKAESSPFRLNGWAPNWQARQMGCATVPAARSGGRTFVSGFAAGVMFERLGYPMHGNDAVYELMLQHAETRLGKI